MKAIIRKCELCRERQAQHRHHIFPQTKHNRKLYGDCIDTRKNILYLCAGCHLNKTIPTMDETEFCNVMGIEKRGKQWIQK